MSRRPGDWNCGSCQHLNFSRRDSCQRCSEPKVTGTRGVSYGRGSGSGSGPDVRPGDWICSVGGCETHNFASRSCCYKCGAFKEESPNANAHAVSSSSFSRGYATSVKSGDWICGRPGCNAHNFASRMECFKCNSPREQGMER